jgi:hypothetical protein
VSGVIFESSPLLRLFAGCGLGTARHSPSMRLHGSPELCGSSQMARRSRRPPCFAVASVKQKKPAEGGNRAAGCYSPQAEARVTFHRADLRDVFIKGRRCRFDSRLWNPEIALTTITSGHAICHAGRADEFHLSCAFCVAAPATSNAAGRLHAERVWANTRFSGLAARLTRGVDGYQLLTGFTPFEYGSSAE